jgi:hypothetical protein
VSRIIRTFYGVVLAQKLSEAPIRPLQAPHPRETLALLDSRQIIPQQNERSQREERVGQVRRVPVPIVVAAQPAEHRAREAAKPARVHDLAAVDPFDPAVFLGRGDDRVQHAQQVQGRDDEEAEAHAAGIAGRVWFRQDLRAPFPVLDVPVLV